MPPAMPYQVTISSELLPRSSSDACMMFEGLHLDLGRAPSV